MEVELQYPLDIASFYGENQNADINLNERALGKNRNLTPYQKNSIRELVRDINDYSKYDSLSGYQLAEASDKYRKLMNLSGIYNIRDYIKTGTVTGKELVAQASIDNNGEVKEVVYLSNFPGCPKENDMNKGYVPSTWIDEGGQEVEQVIEGQWVYDQGEEKWKGTINGETIYKKRSEVPEWEVFVPKERVIKKVIRIVPEQLRMDNYRWEKGFRGNKKRKSDGTYQTRVGSRSGLGHIG